MERILQEISAVGRHLQAMDVKITDLSADSKLIRMDIDSFQDKVTDLDHCLLTVENLEDRSRRDNVRFFGLPEKEEGEDLRAFLKDFLPTLTGLTFSTTLEFQRAHRIGPLHKNNVGRPCPIVACFLRHNQVRPYYC
ncbi:hypothetical protein NDU88_000434 [Pleurodeles waltl]|uniref:Uncharacterized protein n=1 Tax=Pleurodeles waltl TaxID=8319 RepID=A0AAV7UPY6_PLEWA|nr:hypothetical protein NDU88_000434 [Pleurodeles waltl]